jgi:2-iminobutanoate/2-iminopropanoate deaminase
LLNRIARHAWITGLLLAGCGSVPAGLGVPWVPQGPGKSLEEAQAERGVRRAEAPRPAPRAAEPAPRTAPREAADLPPATARAGLEAFTQGTRYGDLLFVSGQIAIDARSSQLVGTRIDEQTRQALENVRAVLESHRLTFANVVSVTVYLKDINDFRGMEGVYETYFRGSLPARSVVEVARLPRGALVQVSVVAGR